MTYGNDVKWPELSRTEYARGLRALLKDEEFLKQVGLMTPRKVGNFALPWNYAPGDRDIEDIINSALDDYDLQGANPGLPYYQYVAASRAQRMWDEQQAKDYQQSIEDIASRIYRSQLAGQSGSPYPFSIPDDESLKVYQEARKSYTAGQEWEANVQRDQNIQRATMAGERGQPYPFTYAEPESWDAYEKAAAKASKIEAQTGLSNWIAKNRPYGVDEEQRAKVAGMYEKQAIEFANRWSPKTQPSNNEELAKQWEEMRRVLQSEVSNAPRDWYSDWQRGLLSQAQNPYTPRERPASDVIQEVKSNLDLWKKEEKDARDAFNALAARKTDDATIVDNAELDLAGLRYDRAAQTRSALETRLRKEQGWNAEEMSYAAPRQTATGDYEAGKPEQNVGQIAYAVRNGVTYPTKMDYERAFGPEYIPSDILPFIGNQSKTQMAGEKWGQPIVTPSGQQWAATPYSTRERLWGYAEAFGRQPQDILNQMEMGRPNTPYISRSWSPSRQRV